MLQARRDWTGAELADRLEVTRSTVRRDVERLRELGYPIESLARPRRRLPARAPAAEMPPLLLDDEEAIAIAVGLRTRRGLPRWSGIEEASLRALVKLEQVLPARLRPRLRALRSATTLPGRGPHRRPAAACARSAPPAATPSACASPTGPRRAPRRGATSSRTPWSTTAAAGTSSPGTCEREDWRSFRLDRIARPAATAVRFTPRELPAQRRRPPSSSGHRGDAEPLRSHADPAARRPMRSRKRLLGAAGARLEPLGESSCEYRTGDDDLDWLALRVAMLGVEFEVLEPHELAEHLAALGERLSRGATQATRARG